MAQIFDTAQTGEFLDRFFDALIERVTHGDWGVIGIHRRGDVLAERLLARMRDRGLAEPPLGVLDITLYRDDFSPGRPQPTVRPSKIPFSVNDARILLIDDVFQTGRTIRAALQQLADFGRPRQVVLATFIDRRQRELPISPDHVGVFVERPGEEQVHLHLNEVDGVDQVTTVTGPEDV